tara:strand:+ start:681 stop:929 length:249 start_codon:yes stop_codon:yes gene_type:complete
MNPIQNINSNYINSNYINWECLKGSKLYMKNKFPKYNYITFNHTTFNIKQIDVNINSVIEEECKNIRKPLLHNNNHITWLEL